MIALENGRVENSGRREGAEMRRKERKKNRRSKQEMLNE